MTAVEPTADDLREYDLAMRQGFLKVVDALERKLGIKPRTAELRKAYREGRMIGPFDV